MAITEQTPQLIRLSTWSRVPGDGDIPVKKLVKALLAISLGTIMMWYDVTVYAQLSKPMGKLFFPSGDPTMQELSLWLVYFVGFISRPVGALLFGHLGDTRGRSRCLLVSVLVMGIPTILIGCLPVYSQVGIAAPVLLALLSLIQGLALGGESGAGKVYLHEIADTRFKAVTGSLSFVSLGAGVVLGISIDALVVSLVPSEELMVWGWRLPFLVSLVALLASVALRWDMPEPNEFTINREEVAQDHQNRHLQQTLQVTNKDIPEYLDATGIIPTATHMPSTNAGAEDVDLAYDVADNVAVDGANLESQESLKKRHHVPVVELLRSHWIGLALQIGYEAWIAASFYLAYTWLPSIFMTYVGLSMKCTLWMVLTSMVIFTLVVPVAGILSDSGSLPPLTGTTAVCVVAAGVSVPMFLAFRTKHLAACWLLQIASLCMTGYTMGVLPVICSKIYPGDVRTTGVNLGHNLGMTLFGGLTPLVLTAIQHGTGSIFLGPALWMTGMAIISVVCSVLRSMLIKCYPVTNGAARAEHLPRARLGTSVCRVTVS